jgi:putative sterol carrier protein
MPLKESVDALRAKVAAVNDLNSVLKFDCGADGAVIIDGKVSPHSVDFGARDDADVVITLSAADFADIVSGKVNPRVAAVMGKIKVKGDKSPLLKLQEIL